jgi:hypothetical protein
MCSRRRREAVGASIRLWPAVGPKRVGQAVWGASPGSLPVTFGDESALWRVPPLFLQEYHSRDFIFDLCTRISFQTVYFYTSHKSINLKTLISVSASLALQQLRSGKNFPYDSLARRPALSNEAAPLEWLPLVTRARSAGTLHARGAKVNIYFTARVKRGSVSRALGRSFGPQIGTRESHV